MISFQPPIHTQSEKKQALLISPDYSKVINLLDEGVNGCPDRITDFDREYQYEGVEYGRAVYRETDNLDKRIIRSIEGIAEIIERVNERVDSQYINGECPELPDIVEGQQPTPIQFDENSESGKQAIRLGQWSLFYAESIKKVRDGLLTKLKSMLENPPGYEGIVVNGEHYGNKYIDYGWQEAVRRVIAMIEGEEINPK